MIQCFMMPTIGNVKRSGVRYGVTSGSLKYRENGRITLTPKEQERNSSGAQTSKIRCQLRKIQKMKSCGSSRWCRYYVERSIKC